MKKCIFFAANGLPSHIVQPSNDADFVDGQLYGGLLCKDFGIEQDNAVALETWHWDGQGIATHAPQPEGTVWDADTFEWKPS